MLRLFTAGCCLVVLSACGGATPPPDELRADVEASPRPPSQDGPFVLQDPDVGEQAPADRTWESARTDGEQALLLAFLGSEAGDGACQAEYRGTARVVGDDVVVDVEVLRSGAADEVCPAIGYDRTVRVELPEPLAGRTVVDARTGRPGALLDGATLLNPPEPPDGYAFDAEAGGFTAGPSWSVRYAKPDRGPTLVVSQGADDGALLEDIGALVERVDVRGHEAVVLSQGSAIRVAWRERGGVVVVQEMLTFGQDASVLMTADELVAFARTLR